MCWKLPPSIADTPALWAFCLLWNCRNNGTNWIFFLVFYYIYMCIYLFSLILFLICHSRLLFSLRRPRRAPLVPQLLLMFSSDVAAAAAAGRTQLVELKENCEMFTNPLSGCRLVSGTARYSRDIPPDRPKKIHMYFYMRLYRQLYIHLLSCSYDLLEEGDGGN